MAAITVQEISLVGLSLKQKTSNAHGQSSIDCKNLWHQFEDGNYAAAITDKLGDEIYGVYHHYEGDSSRPFSYFIGCRVKTNAPVPAGLERMLIPAGKYEKIPAKGKMPDCVIKAWKEIWNAGYNRAYDTDFEVYDERSRDWNNAAVDVYISVRE